MKIRYTRTAAILRVTSVALCASLLAIKLGGAARIPSVDSVDPTRASSSTAYALQLDEWVKFDVKLGRPEVKLVTNAIVNSSRIGRRGDVRYAVDYRITDSEGQFLEEGRHWMMSRSSALATTDGRRRWKFVKGPGREVLQNRSFVIQTRDVPRAAEVAVRLGKKEEDTEAIFVRGFVKDLVPPYRAKYLWHRLAQNKRQLLARRNVYSADLLTDFEKENLLRNRWVAIPPIDDAASAVRERLFTVVYRSAEDDQDLADSSSFVHLQPEIVEVIRIPPQSESLVMSVRVGEESSPEQPRLWCRWRDVDNDEIVEEEIEIVSSPIRIERRVRGSTLELRGNHVFGLQVQALSGKERRVLFPERERVRAYRPLGNVPLEFDTVLHWRDSTPFRIHLRVLRSEESSALREVVAVNYELIALDRRVMGRGSLIHSGAISKYASVKIGGEWIPVSDRSIHYLTVPHGCHFVRLSSPVDGLLVSVATRPNDLPLRRTVPKPIHEDVQTGSSLGVGRNWFSIYPSNAGDLIKRGREVFVTVRPRPKSDVVDTTVSYQSKTLHPTTIATGTDVLVRSKPASSGPLDLYRFYELTCGDEREIVCQDARHPPPLEILVIRPRATAGIIEVLLHGESVKQAVTLTRSSYFTLEEVSRGSASLRVDCSGGGRVFMRGCVDPDADVWRKRRVYRLGPSSPLGYRVAKRTAGTERIRFSALQSLDVGSPLVVRVSIQGFQRTSPSAWGSWTAKERVVTLGFGAEAGALGIETDEGEEFAAQSFTVSLGDDVPPGSYDVQVSVVEGEPSWFGARHLVERNSQGSSVRTRRDRSTGGAR